MAQAISKDKVLSVLQRRYDYQSAQVVLKRAVEAAKLSERDQYTSEELRSIGQGLQQVGDRLDAVLAELSALSATAPAATASVVDVERPSRSGLEPFRDRSAREAVPGGGRTSPQAERSVDEAPSTEKAEATDEEIGETSDASGEEVSDSESTDAKPRSGRRRR